MASLTFLYRKLFCGASAAFLRGAEGSIKIFLQCGELTRKVSPTVFWDLQPAKTHENQLLPVHGRPSAMLSILWLFEGDDTFGRHSGSSVSAKTELRHH